MATKFQVKHLYLEKNDSQNRLHHILYDLFKSTLRFGTLFLFILDQVPASITVIFTDCWRSSKNKIENTEHKRGNLKMDSTPSMRYILNGHTGI